MKVISSKGGGTWLSLIKKATGINKSKYFRWLRLNFIIRNLTFSLTGRLCSAAEKPVRVEAVVSACHMQLLITEHEHAINQYKHGQRSYSD